MKLIGIDFTDEKSCTGVRTECINPHWIVKVDNITSSGMYIHMIDGSVLVTVTPMHELTRRINA